MLLSIEIGRQVLRRTIAERGKDLAEKILLQAEFCMKKLGPQMRKGPVQVAGPALPESIAESGATCLVASRLRCLAVLSTAIPGAITACS